VKSEVLAFADINVAWLTKVLTDIGLGSIEVCERRARAIYTAVAGAQLIARTRFDIGLFDELIQSYQAVGLLAAPPAASLPDLRTHDDPDADRNGIGDAGGDRPT
jgi:TetR/AcrR family transcriptional repressor of nem operon